jgi:putative transposase
LADSAAEFEGSTVGQQLTRRRTEIESCSADAAMPKKRRVLIPGLSLHVIHRGNNREPTFQDDRDCEWFQAILRRTVARCEIRLHAYALMSNHYHLLVTPTNAAAFPHAMKALAIRYVGYYNRKYHRSGNLWGGRYRAFHIEDERYWLTCLRYIEQNPVRAGLVRSPEEYQWSSYRAHAFGKEPNWLTAHPVYLALGDDAKTRQAAYRAICDPLINETELADQRLDASGTP